MPRTTAQIQQAALDAEEWLDSLDPDETPGLDATDLRAIAAAVAELGDADQRLHDAVNTARANGHTWTSIGAVLGVSKQAATQRYGEAHATR